jgi:hypothetical protein
MALLEFRCIIYPVMACGTGNISRKARTFHHHRLKTCATKTWHHSLKGLGRGLEREAGFLVFGAKGKKRKRRTLRSQSCLSPFYLFTFSPIS